MYPRTEEAAAKIYAALDGKSDKFKVYRSARVPAGLHFDGNLREGDPVVVATGPYLIRVNAPLTGVPLRIQTRCTLPGRLTACMATIRRICRR